MTFIQNIDLNRSYYSQNQSFYFKMAKAETAVSKPHIQKNNGASPVQIADGGIISGPTLAAVVVTVVAVCIGGHTILNPVNKKERDLAFQQAGQMLARGGDNLKNKIISTYQNLRREGAPHITALKKTADQVRHEIKPSWVTQTGGRNPTPKKTNNGDGIPSCDTKINISVQKDSKGAKITYEAEVNAKINGSTYFPKSIQWISTTGDFTAIPKDHILKKNSKGEKLIINHKTSSRVPPAYYTFDSPSEFFVKATCTFTGGKGGYITRENIVELNINGRPSLGIVQDTSLDSLIEIPIR